MPEFIKSIKTGFNLNQKVPQSQAKPQMSSNPRNVPLASCPFAKLTLRQSRLNILCAEVDNY